MNVVLFGATGMVGAGARVECLADDRVQSVVALTRSPIEGRMHPKLREVRRDDFFHYNDCRAEFAGCDACFFCLGVSSVGMDERAYTRLTYEAAFMFRPGYIQPVGSVRSRTGWVQASYTVIAPLYPILRRVLPNATTTTANLGRALIQVAAAGYPTPVLYSQDMNRLAVGRPFQGRR